MENSYGIGVQNRYELFFDEDADPFDMIKKPVVKDSIEEKENKDKSNKAKSATAKKSTKIDAAPKSTEKTAVQGKSQQSAPQQPGSQRNGGENRVKFSDREERNNRRNRPEGARDAPNAGAGQTQRYDNDERPRRFDGPRRFEGERPRRFEGGEDGQRPPRRFEGGEDGQRGPRRYEGGEDGQRPPRRYEGGEDGQRPPRRFEGGEDGQRPPRRFEGGEDGGPRRFNDGGPPRRYNDGERRFDGEGRGRGGRGGMGRGRGRGAPGGTGGKREFDRHSTSERSGVKAVDKREGSGSYNWGSAKDQITEETQISDQLQATELDTAEDKEKVVPAPGEEGAVSGNESGGEAGPKEDEEPKEMTLDEYKAMQQQNRIKPEFKLRKAGEGENSAQWKKTYILKKKVAGSDEEESTEEEDDDEPEHHNKKKIVLDIDFQFSDSPIRGGRGRGRGGSRGGPGGRGGRGGMGGERGDRMGGGRGGMGGRGDRMGGGSGGYNRGGRGMGRQEAPKMDDEENFPTLGLALKGGK